MVKTSSTDSNLTIHMCAFHIEQEELAADGKLQVLVANTENHQKTTEYGIVIKKRWISVTMPYNVV